MTWQRFSILPLAVVVIVIPFAQVAVWDGRFLLSIVIKTSQPIEPSELLFAACWRESEAEYAIEHGPTVESRFELGEAVGDKRYRLSLPCSGRSGPFGIEYTYHQPLFLVVQYSITEGAEKVTRRKRFDIPTGRGPKSICITLP
jgi:hypothetical protein